MNISGIRPTLGFYDYNSIKIRPETIDSFEPEKVRDAGVTAQESNKPSEQEIAAAREKQTFGSYEFANTYKANEVYEMKGSDSDIRTLDVEKAVSDMRKDSVLQQYQFFVGKDGITADIPSVRGAEDFAL